MKSGALKKTLSVLLSVLMVLGTVSSLGALTAMAATDDRPAHPDAYLLGKYFSNSWIWYDAATGQNRLSWKTGDFQTYNESTGMTHLNSIYLQISTPRLLEGITADTGVTFSYTYTPQLNNDHRHVFSFGANEYSGSGSNANNHFYISATKSWMGGNKFPFVGFVSGETQTINAYPENGPDFVMGTTYSVVITITKNEGVLFNINGTDYTAAYYNSNLNEQKTNIETLLNSLPNYQYNYIGVSRWGDGYFTGDFKDLSIYSRAFTKTELDTAPLPAGFAAEALANFDVNELSTANAQFTAVPAHQGDPMTDAYSNYVYAGWTAWSGDGFNDVGWGIGRTTFKVAVPGDNVLVYDGIHDVIAPITLESWSNDTSGQSQIIKYVADNADQFDLMQNWYGYSSTWNVWAKNHISTAESFSHLRDTDPESPATQRDGASRFWWNKLEYTGSGNTLTYYSADYNITYHAQTAYRNSASTSHDFREGDMTSNSHYYVINYKPIYDILSEAAAFYNENISGQEWKYTEASLNQAMSALYLIQLANPNLYTYEENVKGDVQKCASAIKLALREYSQIQLVKKTATVHIVPGTGTTITVNGGTVADGDTVEYGDTLTVTAAADESHNKSTPVLKVNGTAVENGGTLTVNDDLVITTDDLSLNVYDVTFKDRNGTTLYPIQHIEHGSDATPPADQSNYGDGFTHSFFTGWTNYQNITADTVVTPVYETSEHVFDQQNTDSFYLKKAATCTAPALYYWSCVCSLRNSTTFEYGAPTGHHYAPPAAEDWSWTKDGDTYTATVTVSCEKNDDTRTLTAAVQTIADVAATAEADGYKTFRATVTVGEGEAAQTFTAEKTVNYFYVAVTPGVGTTITGAETGEYADGTVLTVTAAAQPGYDAAALTLNVNDAAAENPAEITVIGQTTITTNDLTANTYTITWVDQWGAVLKTASGQYGSGTFMPLTDPADVRIEDKVYAFDHWDNGKTAGESVLFNADQTITAIYTLTDQVAKYTVTFLNDDNNTKIAEAEYEWQQTVEIPDTPVSTNRTVALDYTFLGWTPEVETTVTADATYVATYETEPHSRIYHVKWVYGLSNEFTAIEEDLPYDTVFTAETVPADRYVKDDKVTHDRYSWETRIGTALADHIGGSTTEAVITGTRHIDGHAGTPDYEWVGSDETGYTKCIATMTCTLCGEELRAEYTLGEDDVYTHVGENCGDQGYTRYSAWLNGSGENSYFENQNKKVYGEYGDHYYPSSATRIVWNTADPANVTFVIEEPCYFCDHVKRDYGTVSVHERTPATCISSEKTVFKAEFEAGWTTQYSNEIETAPIDSDAHNYTGWNVRPDDARSTRPVYDAETETWSKGTLVIPCVNTYTLDYAYNPETGEPTVTFNYTVENYAAHDKVLTDLDRADYDAFDEALAKLQTVDSLDIADDAVVTTREVFDLGTGEMTTVDVTFAEFREQFLTSTLARAEAFPQNLVTIPEGSDENRFDEQPQVDNMVREMQYGLDMIFNEDGTPKEALLNHYDVTFTLKNGVVTSYNEVKGAEVAVPEAPAEVDGYAFLGWTLDGSTIALSADAATHTVTGNADFTAKYADTPTSCTVTFLKANGDVLATLTLDYGALLAEDQIPTVPAKEADDENHYIGAWDAEIVTTVIVDATYQAVYTPEAHTGGTATCTEQAKCSVCDRSYGALAEHSWKWVNDLEPTCGTPGKKHQKCDNCTATQALDTEIEPTGEHSFTVLQSDENGHWYKCENCTAVTATESHTGGTATCTEQAKCEVCDTPYGELADHSWSWVNDTAPTCGEAGVRHEECSVCHITRSEGSVAPATGNHTPGETAVENNVAPTCTEGGGYDSVVKCSVCGNELSRTHVTVGALGHNFGEWTETAHPTCTEAGEKQRICSRCPETETETVPALGHDYTAWATVTPATCTEAGSEARGCTRCDLAETRTVPALGHSWGAWVVIAEPTIEADGLRRRECERCDAYEEEALAYSGETNRQIQFVVSGDMHYVVHMRDVDYEIYSRTTPAIRWYDNTALTFDVHTHSGWGDRGVLVSVNGEELKPNADGSYTIPGGTDYVQINTYAVDTTATSNSGDVCNYCGKVHPNSLWGRIVAFFHLIFWF
ncbi:MAG: hypothetical protein IK108_01930, partial [Clostridia bacterium]|nr:hypothetical protein [Clostridia bacterium]